MSLAFQNYQTYHPNSGVVDREAGKVYGRIYSEYTLEDLALIEAEHRLNDEGELICNSEWVAVRHRPEDEWSWFEVAASMSVDYRVIDKADIPDDSWWGYKTVLEKLRK